ncbi:dihydrolipoyl dehydrogenase family protein [Amnibacterium endophyticum]|uniref:Dihydrolipoyl dehydrogenase family protein n=1 Tax=Amnibacterium endophyticum TaxID=2109337 RepID=A0ABW4LHT0_9MICO
MGETCDDRIDLLVIGGGTAGLVAARTASSFGARPVLVERDEQPGGDCLWTGCVPSKALLEAAADGVDDRAALARVRAATADIAPVDSAAALEADGVRVLRGTARFTGPRTAVVDGRPLRFAQAVIATGSRPLVPDVPGLEDPLTTDTLWDLEELPARLLVLGGGPAGCELAQAAVRLGSAVTLVQRAERLLPRDVPDASAAVIAAIVADGIDVRLGASLDRVDGGTAVVDGEPVRCDRVLVVAGRRPNTAALGLGAAGVAVGPRGHVRVRRTLLTTSPRVWAAGDATPLPQYTHTAGMNGAVVAANAVLGLRRTIDEDAVPHCTFTQPEVAAVGRTRPAGGDRVHRVAHDEVDRAVAARRTGGFTEVVVDGRGRVVGATVVAPRAGETIGEAALAVRTGLTVEQVTSTTHPYPTFSDGFWNACIAAYRSSLASGATARGVAALAAARRLRLRLS